MAKTLCLPLSLAVLLTACGRGAGDGAAAPVRGLYRTLIDTGVTGAPSPEQLAAIAPFLGTELRGLLDSARAVNDAQAVAHPDEKPPFAEGDLFSSLFEGPTTFEALPDVASPDGRRVPVRLRDDRPSPAVEWTDTVVVREEGGRMVVADILFGGTWDFANRGSLVASLRAALRAETDTAVVPERR